MSESNLPKGGRKFSNYAQLVQSVCQVQDPTLEPTDRLFLNCLAAHSVSGSPHPGNARLMLACGIRSRQGLNKIEKRLRGKHLIEIVTPGGGAGVATVYRIVEEDPRFPSPKEKTKPATVELPVSGNKPATLQLPIPGEKPATPELPVSDQKPATGSQETCNSPDKNPQLGPEKPATLGLHPDVNLKDKDSDKRAEPPKSPVNGGPLNERFFRWHKDVFAISGRKSRLPRLSDSMSVNEVINAFACVGYHVRILDQTDPQASRNHPDLRQHVYQAYLERQQTRRGTHAAVPRPPGKKYPTGSNL